MPDSDTVTDGNARRAAITMLTTMFLEERQAGRHQEAQRSTVSTIVVSLATAAFALTGVLWNRTGYLDLFALPITATIALLGIFGFLVTTKLFERSMMHYSLSEAYRETIQALSAPDIHAYLPVGADSVLQLPYVKNANRKIGWYPAGKKFTEVGPKFSVLTTTHDVVDPRPIVIPLHNENARFFGRPLATMRLYALWNVLFIGIVFLGIGLSLAAIFWPEEHRTKQSVSSPATYPAPLVVEVRH